MLVGKEKINKLNSQNTKEYNDYLRENNSLVTIYQDKKDKYNNNINIINSEKISMRDELRKLYDFLAFVGGSLERKVSMVDFVEEAPAPNMDADIEDAAEEGIPSDVPIFGIFVNKNRMKKLETGIYLKSIDYKKNLKKKRQAVARMEDCADIAKMYRDVLATLKDAIREKIIPEFEYIRAFLVADAIREAYVAGNSFKNIKPCKIVEYKDTKYNSHYQFVKNTFDFLDLCKAFFSKAILTELMSQEEITDTQREEFNQSIYAIQDKLALLENDMEVKH